MRHALLFDYDGLIVDTETVLLEVFIEVLAKDGHAFELDEFGHLLGSSGPENDKRWEDFLVPRIGAYDNAAMDERIGAIARPRIDALSLLPGVEDLVRAARATGWRTGIATGNTRERVMERLISNGLEDAFEELVTTLDVSRAKPAPDIYLELARRLEVEPQNCVVLEDSAQGCRSALDAGMTVVLCPCDATRSCDFPDGVRRVESLLEVRFDLLPELLVRKGA